MTHEVNIKYVEKLHPVFTKPKRIKIIVGGRGSTKSTGIADYVLSDMSTGALWCCARENQNSIEESVHRTMLDEIDRLGFQGFTDTKSYIAHESGGRNFYRGLSRNITSLKSTLSGVDGLWIEEGEDISANTLRVLTASVRLNAKDTEALLAGNKVTTLEEIDALLAEADIDFPEIIITMNRGRRDGAIAKQWLKRAEAELERTGYYEDDLIMVVELNYTDMPRSWFLASGMEQERLDDYDKMSRSQYDHKWHGKYLDEVENAIIKAEWVDACKDAHKLPHLKRAFEPHGVKIAAHDPFDDGGDAAAYSLRHGSIIRKVKRKSKGEIDECCDWATDNAKADGADVFRWDGDGMGTGLKRQVRDNLAGTRTSAEMFKGSLSGKAQDNAKRLYMKPENGRDENPASYADTFLNNRAQYYTELANRCYNTYRCVVRGEYVNPDEMISFDTDGIESWDALRTQLCSIPKHPGNRNGLIQILGKSEMKRLKIASPNEADAVMMTLPAPSPKDEDDWNTPLEQDIQGIV
ncbi:phage terminase large subunit [Aestuariibacter halophilus]|uniref:Phage terminase large subunit n=1 Tax=Fluctibacter halophilus TaxID=226011 RepID=A0ABS8G5U2_9ALTE|nr:phage terminase large subunit [Aestuariibacter halophilus]MCC2615942.1 phage terminase large subunit [Aestuariibacter halophilus]